MSAESSDDEAIEELTEAEADEMERNAKLRRLSDSPAEDPDVDVSDDLVATAVRGANDGEHSREIRLKYAKEHAMTGRESWWAFNRALEHTIVEHAPGSTEVWQLRGLFRQCARGSSYTGPVGVRNWESLHKKFPLAHENTAETRARVVTEGWLNKAMESYHGGRNILELTRWLVDTLCWRGIIPVNLILAKYWDDLDTGQSEPFRVEGDEHGGEAYASAKDLGRAAPCVQDLWRDAQDWEVVSPQQMYTAPRDMIGRFWIFSPSLGRLEHLWRCLKCHLVSRVDGGDKLYKHILKHPGVQHEEFAQELLADILVAIMMDCAIAGTMPNLEAFKAVFGHRFMTPRAYVQKQLDGWNGVLEHVKIEIKHARSRREAIAFSHDEWRGEGGVSYFGVMVLLRGHSQLLRLERVPVRAGFPVLPIRYHSYHSNTMIGRRLNF
jgi:hypothetical protein